MRFTILMLMLTASLYAQKPEKIHPNAREQKPVEYLKAQSKAWKAVIDKDPSNTEAWYNYYYANRNLGFNDQSRTSEEKQAVINQLLDEMGKAIPESYEYNLCKWMNGGWNMKLVNYLEKAQKAGPDRPEHLDYSIVLAEMRGDRKSRDLWSKKKHEAGQFSTGLLYYNYNVLAGLAPNAILLVAGDNDTFPLWYLQSLGVRPDVTLVHTTLVMIDEYRKPVFASLGIAEMKLSREENYKNLNQKLVEHVASNNKSLPVYIGLTATECLNQSVGDNLYLAGLAYAHSKTPMDNVALLRKNFEQQYSLDYIDKPFYNEISPDMVKHANGNYIVPMLRLYEHYKLSGEKQRQEWIRTKLLAVAKETDEEAEVKKLLAAKD